MLIPPHSVNVYMYDITYIFVFCCTCVSSVYVMLNVKMDVLFLFFYQIVEIN